MVSEFYGLRLKDRLRLKEAVDALYLPGSPRVMVGRDGVVMLTFWDHEGEALDESLSRSDVVELIQALEALLGVMGELMRPLPSHYRPAKGFTGGTTAPSACPTCAGKVLLPPGVVPRGGGSVEGLCRCGGGE